MQATGLLSAIPSGKAGTLKTLEIMRRVVLSGKKSLPVRHTALFIVDGLYQKDYLGEIKAIHKFVRDCIRYTRDIRGVETVQIPELTLRIKKGDCDDKAILIASLLESIGHKTRFEAIGFIPGRFSHVYVSTLLNGKWIPLETTEPVPMGWLPKFKHKIVLEI